MNVDMARLGKRERARRRSNTCKQLYEEICTREKEEGTSRAMVTEAPDKEKDLKITEIAVKEKMVITALLHREKAPAAPSVEIQEEEIKRKQRLDMQREKKKIRSIEEIALKKMEMAQSVLCSIGTEAMSEEKLTKLRIAARGLTKRIEEMADTAAQECGRRTLRRAETCRLKRKVGRLQESKRALKKQVREAQDALHKQHKELEERTLCMICHDLPRDTFVLPCLHFLYCFSCLSKHSSSNNSCPSCRRSILGLCMASSLSST